MEEKKLLLEKQRELVKQKEELLQRQLSQQKELLEKMSQAGATVSMLEKRELLNKISSLSEQLALCQKQKLPIGRDDDDTALVPNSDQTELSGLKAELSALEAQVATNNNHGRTRGSGGGARWSSHAIGGRSRGGRTHVRGERRGGGRSGGTHHSLMLDNRTRIVQVGNLPESARDIAVLEQHFGQFGSIERVLLQKQDDGNADVAYITFQDRFAGQSAISHGNVFDQTTLTMQWVEENDVMESTSSSVE